MLPRFFLQIIPLYFHHSKLGSFKRQLGLYAFKRVGKKRIEMEYHHEFFCKGEPCLLSRIKRACKKKSCSDSKTSKAASAAGEKKEVTSHDDDEDDDDDEACEQK
jgi:HSF-type DNA-binding